MIGELLKIAGQCDGVRCDMAMLVLPDVFERTWGRRAPPFWPRATRRVRERVPGLLLHGRGLLGPRMDDAAAGVRLRLRQAALRPPARGARAAGARALPAPGSTTRTSSPASWRTTTSRGPRRPSRPACTRPRPSSRSCRRACGSSTRGSSRAGGSASRRTWCRAPAEPVDETLRRFYDGAPGGAPAARPFATASGSCSSARRPGTATGRADGFIAFAWQGPDGRAAAGRRELRREPEPVLRPPAVRETCAGRPCGCGIGRAPRCYDRSGDDLAARGLYLDVPPWGYHVFDVGSAS